MANRGPRRRIAINTGGGDAPGLNAVIRAVTVCALRRGWEVLGIRKGFASLLGQEPLLPLEQESVRGIAHLGGTILGTTNRGDPFKTYLKLPGSSRRRLAAELIVEKFKALKLDGLIAVGGDGSLAIALGLMRMGIPVVGVPKTIDNDLDATARTFGFDTAVDTATLCLDKLHSTAHAHDRSMVVEVMGRYAGWIALHSGLATSADVILIPEIRYDLNKIARYLLKRKRDGRPYSIVVVAEGAREVGKGYIYLEKAQQRLGGAGAYVAQKIEALTGIETRSLVLGHLQRGGSPTTYDRVLALRFGGAAVRMVEAGEWGHMVAYQPPQMVSVPLQQALLKRRVVPLECDTVKTAREMGICLGD